MISPYLDLIKETAYEIWRDTRKPFCSVDIYDRMCLHTDYKSLPSFKAIGRILKKASWAKPKHTSGVGLAYATYTWRGE